MNAAGSVAFDRRGGGATTRICTCMVECGFDIYIGKKVFFLFLNFGQSNRNLSIFLCSKLKLY